MDGYKPNFTPANPINPGILGPSDGEDSFDILSASPTQLGTTDVALGFLKHAAAISGNSDLAENAKQARFIVRWFQGQRAIQKGEMQKDFQISPIDSARNESKWWKTLMSAVGMVTTPLSVASRTGVLDSVMEGMGIGDGWRTYTMDTLDSELQAAGSTVFEMKKLTKGSGLQAAWERFNALNEGNTEEEWRDARLGLMKASSDVALLAAKVFGYKDVSAGFGIVSAGLGGVQLYNRVYGTKGVQAQFDEMKSSATAVMTQQIRETQALLRDSTTLSTEERRAEISYYEQELTVQVEYLATLDNEHDLAATVHWYNKSVSPLLEKMGVSPHYSAELSTLTEDIQTFADTMLSRQSQAIDVLTAHQNEIDKQLVVIDRRLDFLNNALVKKGMGPRAVAITRKNLVAIKMDLLSHSHEVEKAMKPTQSDPNLLGHTSTLDEKSMKERTSWAIEAYRVVQEGKKLDVANRIEQASTLMP